MARKRFTAEQIIITLREAGYGLIVRRACRRPVSGGLLE